MNGCKACLSIIENDKPIFYLSNIYMSPNSPCDTISIKEKLADCVPELRDIVNNAVICKHCVVSLTAAYDFLQQCLKVQHKVCSYLQQMPVNSMISMEQIALHYERQEIIAEERNPVTEAVCSNNVCLTASEGNMVIKMKKLPVMQEENHITEVVYKSANTCPVPKKPVRNVKLEAAPMQEEVIRQRENPLTVGVGFIPNELNIYSQIQTLQQQPTMYPRYPVLDHANTFSTSDGLHTYSRIQDSAMIPNEMHNMTKIYVKPKPPRKAKKQKSMTNFVCKSCNYKCRSEKVLERHYRVHDKRYHIQCPACKFQSMSAHALNAHMKSKHHDVIFRAQQHIPKKSKKKTKKAKKQQQKQKQLETKPVWQQHPKRTNVNV